MNRLKHTHSKRPLKFKQRALVGSLVLINGLFASGCASMTERTGLESLGEAQSVESTASVRGADRDEAPILQTSTGMNAQIMSQILTAELLVEKGLVANAYALMYPIAEQTQDAGLAKRAFELSMATYEEAEIDKATQLWLALEPNNPTPLRAAYLMSLRQGDVTQAIEQWNTYQTVSDLARPEEVLSTAQRVARSATADDGMMFYEEVVAQNPTLWQSYYGLAVLANHYNLPDKALKSLQEALTQIKASNASADEKLMAQQQVTQLLSQTYLQLEDSEQGLAVLGRYLKQNPDDWLVQERLARLEVKAGKLTEAQVRYELIIKNNPDAFTSRLSLALLQIELQNVTQAKQNLLIVSQEKAYETIGFYYLGVLSQQLEQTEEAIGYFERVTAMPYVVDAKLHIAEMVFPNQGLDGALMVLNSIQADEPATQVKVLRAKAIFYRVSGQNQQAIESYRQALELNPENEEMLLSQAALFYDEQDAQGYVNSLETLLAFNPNSVEALNALGYFYVEQGQALDQATELLERALELAPDSFYVLDSVGWLAYQKQDYKTAKRYLTKALALQHDEEIAIHLIATYWQLGQTQEATQLWKKHQAEFAESKRYQALIERLESGEPIR